MATQRSFSRHSTLKKSRKFRDRARKESRRCHLEQLEDRRVMATGPALAAIIPNGGVFLNNNDTLRVAPRELTFRFAEGQIIDAASILNTAPLVSDNGIRLFRAGPNGTMGDLDDVEIAPGFMGLADSPREVIMRFAENLPDDLYRIQIVGAGATPLKDSSGLPFNGGVDQFVDFNLDLGTKVRAVVPQPITRDNQGELVQNLRTIEVYFDQDELGASRTSPAFYRLINTASGNISLPQTITYDATQLKATLTFAADIPVGTFKLEVGVTDEPNDRTSQAVHLGNSMVSAYQAFIGDSSTPAQDVDLYRFELRANAAITVNLTPTAALNGAIRIFDSTGAPVGVVTDAGGVGAAESVTTAVLAAGTYYVGISSSGNTAYNPVTGVGVANGATTGAYSFQVTFNDLSVSDNNSSFASATPLGVLGLAGRLFGASISAQNFVAPLVNNIPFPGLGDDPGHRDLPASPFTTQHPTEDHIDDNAGDFSTSISFVQYHFPDLYGQTPQGNPLFNVITENQKQRAREIFELYGRYAGVQFVETVGSGFQVVTGDTRAIDPNADPTIFAGIAGSGAGTFFRPTAIMNAFFNWGNSEYGSSWFTTAMHEIGHLLGLGHSYDLPALTVQGVPASSGTLPPGLTANPGEPVFPGDHDILHIQALHRPESRDIDLYQFQVTEAGVLHAETIAERLGSGFNQLNTVLTLYKETSVGTVKREIISRNDDYYSSDSYLELRLEPGIYYVAVTAAGNIEFDPTIPDSGFGGRSEGTYNLKMEFTPDGGSALADATGVRFDGDANGREGGVYEFWFQSGNTVFVDKANDTTPAVDGNGSLANPFDTLAAALAAADAFAQANPGVPSLVRIVGNGGTDGDLLTLNDNKPYLIGFKDQDAILDEPLADGADFMVPRNVTVMIDAGAIFKLRKANMDAGSSAQGVDRSGGAIQVLGTPFVSVRYTSYNDDSIGGDSDGPLPGAASGDWGGIVYRDDSDRESAGVFLNYVNHAFMQYGGGRVFVDSVESVYTPVHLVSARPAISYNTIVQSADAALSGDPNSFDDDGFSPNIAFKNRRIGPDIHDNTLSITTPTATLANTVNGLFVRIRSLAGNPIDRLDVSARFDDLDIVHVIAENLLISGTPGGSISPGADRDPTSQFDARLHIDPGLIVKLGGARIEARMGSQFIAEGSAELPIIFTSIKDDKYGGSGTFDTNRDGSASLPAPGQWGGLVFGPSTSANLDFAQIYYGGGTVPIEGGFDRFNVIEINQADVRVANSVLQFNSNGGSATNRNGRGFSFSSTINVTGAQPVIVNNIIRDNAGPVISINANSMQDTVLADLGRTTGLIGDFNPANDNLASENKGPFVRGNRLVNNGINGMEIRGGVLTTESVWDDTDIAHILRSEIAILNQHVYNGLRLQSRPNESLVVKLAGATAGFTASGVPLDIDDRIGGTLHIVGQPGRPVVLTDLADDTVSAGFQPNGLPLFDTNNNGASTGTAGAWRSIRLDKYSNDFNASIQLERETAQVGNGDANRTPQTAQVLGALAPNEKSGDDIRRLGFEFDGTIAYDRPGDVDVYSFTADSGTEVWIDIDRTSFGLDAMIELVDANGNMVARATDTDPLGRNPPLDPPPNTVGLSGIAQTYNKDPFLGRDFYTTNPHDAIMRVVLPGSNLKNVPYFIRVRSQPASFAGEFANTLNPGLTSGHYQLQVRLRQPDVKPGSTVRFADIRFATNAVEVLGLPYHSPLTSESEEANDGANNSLGGAQQLGNLLNSDKSTLSVGGFIGSVGDVDFYQFELNVDLIQLSVNGDRTWATLFDIDYADGIARPDTTISVFDRDGRLILVSRDGDIDDDQPAAGQGADTDDLSRGTFGKLDPYIGSVQLPAGVVGRTPSRTYYVAVSTNRRLPTVLDQTFNAAATTPGVRLEPIDAIRRIAADHFDTSGGETGSLPDSQLIDSTNLRSVSANIRPFVLGDVALFVSSQDRLYNVDPASGLQEVNIGNPRSSGNHAMADIAMRTDGVLFGYEEFVPGANTAGRLTIIDAGNAAATTQSNDNIPDIPNPPPNPLDPQQVNTVQVGALAWGGTPVNGVGNNTLFYAVNDPASGASRLYRADPANGSAAVVQGQPWGRIGGLTNFITLGNQANGSTNFALGTPTLDIRAVVVGPAGNGITINFTHANLGAGQPPRLNPPIVPGPPATINVEMNLASATAQATTNFNTGGAVTVQFQANQAGAAGNNITLTFNKADLGPGSPPAINVVGTVIQVTLNTNAGNPTTAAGLITAIQNNFQANNLVTAVVTTGNAATIISTPAINYSPLTLSGGADPTTAQQVANLLNTTGIVTASVTAGNPFTPVSFGQLIAPVVLTTGSGGSGFTTGLAFGTDGSLYGVTDRGLFQRQISLANARPVQEVSVVLPGLGTPVFAGLARGPQNVENGRFANLLFAVTTTGTLCALNLQGVPQMIFDTNADGVADSVVLNLATGDTFTGLAFSMLDFNLWHPTFRRNGDTDHDIGPAPTLNDARSNAANNMSFYFGFEQFQNSPGPGSDSYQTYATFDNLAATNGQLGVLSANFQQRLSANAAVNNTYNMPGGAYGSLITDSFSLASLKNTDKPTFYFDYFLETADVNTGNNGNMRDSARVYITRDGGLNWELVATNNSTLDNPTTAAVEGELPTFLSANLTEMPANPRQQIQLLHDNTGSWRQARIDLSRYAGLDGLKLRFDFTTAGEIANPDGSDPATTVTPVLGVKENLFESSFGNFNSPGRGSNNQFEGFYVDNFIIGPSERGEMVINSPASNSNFFATPVPQDLDPLHRVPTEVLSGPYQLEIRRGEETGANLERLTSKINLLPSLDTNEREFEDTRLASGSPTFSDGFESGNLNVLPWNTRDDAPWIVTNTTAATGTFSAASGLITHGQKSGLEVALVTSQGNVSFARSVSSQAGDVLNFYIDGILRDTYSGNLPFQTVSYAVSAGRHHFRWSYDKNAAGSAGLDRAFIDNVTFPTPQRGTGGIGDQNLTRDQGQILIEQNSIFAPSQVGILVDAGGRDTPDGSRTYPGGVRNLPTLNNDLLAPGTTLTNNVVANFGQVGIRFSGDANAALTAEAATPFGRIVNNTVYGGATANGIGIQVTENAGPTMLNNILSNTATGIVVDASSNATTVIGENLFSGNTANGPLGQESIVLPPGTLLFVDPANRNFYLVSGSPAIDSSLNSLVDRESIKAVKSIVGIPESPILAPDRDVFGQLRIDDPSQDPPPGLGANIFKDRGAVERADFAGPVAQLIDPLDNDGAFRDRDPDLTEVIIKNEILTRFTIKLLDLGTGIDDLTVNASKFTLTKDGVLMVLGVDYTFLFNSNSDEVTFLPVSGQWENNRTYVILLDNSPLTGIRDLAANPVLPNQTDGTTKFTIFVGTVRDFGDAPSPYPSLNANNGAAHDVTLGYHLGANVDEEQDAKIATGDSFDDGITNILLSPGNPSSFTVTASGSGFLDVWIDLNKDGDWADPGENVLVGRAITAGSTNVGLTFGSPAGPRGQTWARFRFSSAGINSPIGVAPDGEVEDYLVTLVGPPFHNDNLPEDVDNDGDVDTIDLLVELNYITFLLGQLPPGTIGVPLPVTIPPYAAGTPIIDPTGGGVPGQGVFIDVVPNFGVANSLDLNAIVTYLTNHFTPGGGGEGEGGSAPASLAMAPSSLAAASSANQGAGSGQVNASPADAFRTVSLFASPSVVIEERSVDAGPALDDDSWLDGGSDDTLDLVASAIPTDQQAMGRLFSLEDYSKRRTPMGPLDDDAWDELLSSLSLDVGGAPGGDLEDPS